MSVPSQNPCRRNYAVWSKTGTQHPDYYKFVLRNGDINPNTWESVNNFKNDQFLEDKPAYGGLVKTSHKHKITDEEVVVRNVGGRIVVDTPMRDDVYALRDQVDSKNTTLLVDLIRNMPFIGEQQEIQQKLAELEQRVPPNIPRRNEVLDAIIRDYLVSRFRQEIGGSPSENIRRLGTQITPIQDRLRQLVSIASADEQQAIGTMGVATEALAQQGATQQSVDDLQTRRAIEEQRRGRPVDMEKLRILDDIVRIQKERGQPLADSQIRTLRRRSKEQLRAKLRELTGAGPGAPGSLDDIVEVDETSVFR